MNYEEILLVDSQKVENLPLIVLPLQTWFDKHARWMPWRENPDPYWVWISEIMLQQTRVEAVRGYFDRFMLRFPSIDALAEAPMEEVLKMWEGLGYYNRARNLKRTAELLVQHYHSQLPANYDELLSLPGIGEYTAGAIASQAFGIVAPAVDGNVYRVLSRYMESYANTSQPAVQKAYRSLVTTLIPPATPGTFNQSLMELGALVCRPNGFPLCSQCPLQENCSACDRDWALDLPIKNKPKSRKIEARTLLFIKSDHQVLLSQRPEKGLLAGMWQPLNLKGKWKKEEISAYLQELGGSIKSLSPLPSSKHIFSHIEWHMTAWQIESTFFPQPLDTLWITSTESHAIPSAFSVYKPFLDEMLCFPLDCEK